MTRSLAMAIAFALLLVSGAKADVIERVDPADLQENVAVVAALLWMLGESDDTFR